MVTQHTFRESSEPDNSSAASHDSRRPDGFVSKALISKLLPSIAEICKEALSSNVVQCWRRGGRLARSWSGGPPRDHKLVRLKCDCYCDGEGLGLSSPFRISLRRPSGQQYVVLSDGLPCATDRNEGSLM